MLHVIAKRSWNGEMYHNRHFVANSLINVTVKMDNLLKLCQKLGGLLLRITLY